MPKLELELSPKGDYKTWKIKREENIAKLQSFFPNLWAPEYSNHFTSELKIAVQWGEEFSKQKDGPQDIHLNLKRLLSDSWNSIGGRQGDDPPAYIHILADTPYDLLPILVNETTIIDGHHRMASYKELGMAPLVLQITNSPSNDIPKIIAEFDGSVTNKTIVFPNVFKSHMDENKKEETIASLINKINIFYKLSHSF